MNYGQKNKFPVSYFSKNLVFLQTTLARIICDNSDDIRYVQHDVFKRVKRTSEYAACFQHISVDLRFWKECCSERESKWCDNFISYDF